METTVTFEEYAVTRKVLPPRTAKGYDKEAAMRVVTRLLGEGVKPFVIKVWARNERFGEWWPRTLDGRESEPHVWEKAGLGKAPFTFVGMVSKVGPIRLPNGTEVGAPGQPMGCCAYCGQGIKDCYGIRSYDGHEFEVGSECVRHTNDVRLIKLVDEEIRKQNCAKRHAREEAKIAEVKKWMSESWVMTMMSDTSHPQQWGMEKGLTAWDWAKWMMQNAGNSGKVAVHTKIKNTIKISKERAI